MSRFLDPMLSFVRTALNSYRREIANMRWLFFDRLFRVFGNFLIGVVAARLLGPADYGGISYAQTVAAFLMLVVAFGLNSVVVKRLIDRPGEAVVTLGTAALLQALATAAVMAVTIVTTLSGGATDSYAAIVAIVACGLVLRPTEVFRYWFEANVNARRAVIADNVAFLVSGAVKITVLYASRSIEALAWTLVLEQLLGGICLGVAYYTDRSRPGRWRVDRKVARQLVAQAWPLLLSGLAVALYMRIDQFVIMNARGAAETGVYNAAVRLSEIFYVLPTIVATSFFPRWQGLIGKSGDRHVLAVRSAMAGMVAFSVAIALFLSLAASPLVHLLYGDEYERAVPVLAIHAWTCVFVSMGILGNQWYLSHNLQSRTLLCTVLGASSNFAINLMLVPAIGAVGAAIASLAAQIISTFVADVFSSKTRPLFYSKAYALLWPLALFQRKMLRDMPAKESH
jgi:PST family polysaccharide transporter